MSRISAVFVISLIAAILSPVAVATPVRANTLMFRDDVPTTASSSVAIATTPVDPDWLS